jgi:MerR family redox-sensitive transcriptional activator SoxR
MGVAPSAVRWYADEGLLPCERTTSNHRRFFADVQCRVAMIKAAQSVGLTLDEIRIALEALPPRHVPNEDDWERLAQLLRSVVHQRIDALFDLLHELTTASAPEHP